MKTNAIVLGVAAGALGAAVWAAISYFANYEIGYIAWGIGALVGFAVAYGNGDGGPVPGVVAAVITIVSLCAGKYAAIELAIQNALADGDIAAITDENLISYLADDIVAAREAANKPVEWPAGVNPGEAWVATDYPADIWQEATAKWQALSADEQQAFRDETTAEAEAGMDALTNEIRQTGFLASFSAFDLLFFGLGIATAFGIANNADGDT